MAVIKRKRLVTEGAGIPAPSTTSKGGIKRRTSLPVTDLSKNDLPGELGDKIRAIEASKAYGNPFSIGSSKRLDTDRLRTGVMSLDLCLGGGFTTARAHMLYGEKSSGKSTSALHLIATLHRINPDSYAAWVDVEGTFDKPWARKIGVDLNRIIIVEPETGEHAVDLADEMLRTREIEVVVVDSIAMLVPMKELEESSEKDTMALQARLVGKYIRRTNNALIKEKGRGHQAILIHINQFRLKVGLVFGDPRTLPGGKALEFSTTQQVETKNKEIIGKDDDGNDVVLYNEHGGKITKNKGGGPMKEAAYKLVRVNGYQGSKEVKWPADHPGMPEAWIDQAKTIYTMGSQVGVVTGSAQSFQIDGHSRKFGGAAQFTIWALENPIEYQEVQAKIISGFRKKWDL